MLINSQHGFISRLHLKNAEWRHRRKIRRLANEVAMHARPDQTQKPVVVFNTSSRLHGLSQNAAFTLLAAWGLRLASVPVIHFVCQAGMSHCVLGTNRQDYYTSPPCSACIGQSRRLFRGAQVSWFRYHQNDDLGKALQNLNIEELGKFEFPFLRVSSQYNPLCQETNIPLGKLVLPSIRWALRCHYLPDEEPTRYLMREYILSAWHVAREFDLLLHQTSPQAVLIFNGILFPEAAARWVAQQHGARVVTHEVGFQPFSSFFTHGEATAYPIDIPDDFVLSVEQNKLLDAYLEQRFQGKFTMAGIRFWPEMNGLGENFIQYADQFKQVVPIFTNVVYDTSQIHANTIFEHMFAWLDALLKIIRTHPETLFVIRAHPDEMRPGTAKQSRQSVRGWVEKNRLDSLSNLIFIDSQEYISSYELIQRAKFLMVYNSSIGLEAVLMKKVVLCAGKARYTQYPTVFFPSSQEEFYQMAEVFLMAEEIDMPIEFHSNARKFLYFQLYRASIPFDNFLQAAPRPGFVHMRSLSWNELLPERSVGVKIIVEGILKKKPFLLEDGDTTSNTGKD